MKEPGVTEWCSLAVWVPKGDNVRVRLCIDYRELNKLVKRPVHPFPSTREILQAIPVTAKYFAKLDAVHGYFQLALDEESMGRNGGRADGEDQNYPQQVKGAQHNNIQKETGVGNRVRLCRSHRATEWHQARRQ